jgi:hypothetical protein
MSCHEQQVGPDQGPAQRHNGHDLTGDQSRESSIFQLLDAVNCLKKKVDTLTCELADSKLNGTLLKKRIMVVRGKNKENYKESKRWKGVAAKCIILNTEMQRELRLAEETSVETTDLEGCPKRFYDVKLQQHDGVTLNNTFTSCEIANVGGSLMNNLATIGGTVQTFKTTVTKRPRRFSEHDCPSSQSSKCTKTSALDSSNGAVTTSHSKHIAETDANGAHVPDVVATTSAPNITKPAEPQEQKNLQGIPHDVLPPPPTKRWEYVVTISNRQ